jgi:hypothetical protein
VKFSAMNAAAPPVSEMSLATASRLTAVFGGVTMERFLSTAKGR